MANITPRQRALYDCELRGRVMPVLSGTTSDDRMDIANVIGTVMPLEDALAVAERILFSKWYAESMTKAWDEGHAHCFHVEDPNNSERNPYRG